MYIHVYMYSVRMWYMHGVYAQYNYKQVRPLATLASQHTML